MPKGGSKPGERRGGRQKGAANIKTRLIADEALRHGITPLEVMLENMRWHRDRAAEAAKLALTPGLDAAAQDMLRKDAMACRHAAQECAVDAGPYIHPRLANVAHTGKDGGPIEHVTKLSDADLDAVEHILNKSGAGNGAAPSGANGKDSTRH